MNRSSNEPRYGGAPTNANRNSARKTRLSHQSMSAKGSSKTSGGALGFDTRPPRRSGSACFISSACATGVGLPDNCWELEVLRAFRDDHMGLTDTGRQLLAEYDRRAPAIVAAIDALDPTTTTLVYAEIYHTGIRRAVNLVLAGQYDEATELYKSVCETLDARFASHATTTEEDRA